MCETESVPALCEMMGQRETPTHLGLIDTDNFSHNVQLGSYSKDFGFHTHLDLCENFILID
jgi:hypothetical protein